MELKITNRKGETFTVLYDECDHVLVKNYGWYISINGYACACKRINGKSKTIRMHRLILGLKDGDGKYIDHRNLNRADNRRENIRICTNGQNVSNVLLKKNNTTGYKGVVICKKRPGAWEARIKANDRRYYLGYFKDIKEAAQAYDKAAKELHGTFARLNFPE